MICHVLPLLGVALLAAGCVPVTEPVGDIDKSEPDKALVGKWAVTAARETAEVFRIKSITVDQPEVKGNPKGLMRGVMKDPDRRDFEVWFFPATIGKHSYASLILTTSVRDDPPRFNKEGEFAKWRKEENRRYFIVGYARDGESLKMDCGNATSCKALMTEAKIKHDDAMYIQYYLTPARWLDKYFASAGPKELFDGTNYLTLEREKK